MNRNSIRLGMTAMATALSLGLCSGTALADDGWAQVEWANVTHVEPIERQVEHRRPREECWTEQVRHEVHAPPERDSYLGPVLGGVIGGALGNAVGHHKRNKQVGAAVGAIVGATVGHELTRDQRSSSAGSRSYYTQERRCETRYDIEYESRTVGYWVSYEYLGQVGRTRMQEYPGERIRVRVSVEPL